jgi:hypothetical protein
MVQHRFCSRFFWKVSRVVACDNKHIQQRQVSQNNRHFESNFCHNLWCLRYGNHKIIKLSNENALMGVAVHADCKLLHNFS